MLHYNEDSKDKAIILETNSPELTANQELEMISLLPKEYR